MKCPTCNVSLVMSDRNGIEIDYCPDCRGVWLDRGELDKIIERSTQHLSGSIKNDSNYKKDYDERKYDERKYKSHDSEYYHKKKKGFFGELFDF